MSCLMMNGSKGSMFALSVKNLGFVSGKFRESKFERESCTIGDAAGAAGAM